MDTKIPTLHTAPMKPIVLALAVAACGGSSIAQTPYSRDVERICDSVQLSGAQDMPENDRVFTIAMWLGSNVETQDGRDFLVRIQPLVGEDKARALEDEAKRVGLRTCALAAEWGR